MRGCQGNHRHPHRWRRRAGTQSGDPLDHDPRGARRISRARDPPRLGGPRRPAAGEGRRQQREHSGAQRRHRQSCRPDRRHVSPHLAHPAEPSAEGGRSAPSSRQVRKRHQRHHSRRARQHRTPRNRLSDPDRRGRHAQLRRAAPQGRGQGHRHSEDDGQRRPRDGLLHRLQHVRHPHDRARASPAHDGGIARALSRDRGVRPLRRVHRAPADHGRRRRPLRDSRARVRHRAADRAPHLRPQPPSEPVQRRPRFRGRPDDRSDGAVVRRRRVGSVRPPEARRDRRQDRRTAQGSLSEVQRRPPRQRRQPAARIHGALRGARRSRLHRPDGVRQPRARPRHEGGDRAGSSTSATASTTTFRSTSSPGAARRSSTSRSTTTPSGSGRSTTSTASRSSS